jgi:hypothetical protein
MLRQLFRHSRCIRCISPTAPIGVQSRGEQEPRGTEVTVGAGVTQ